MRSTFARAVSHRSHFHLSADALSFAPPLDSTYERALDRAARLSIAQNATFHLFEQHALRDTIDTPEGLVVNAWYETQYRLALREALDSYTEFVTDAPSVSLDFELNGFEGHWPTAAAVSTDVYRRVALLLTAEAAGTQRPSLSLNMCRVAQQNARTTAFETFSEHRLPGLDEYRPTLRRRPWPLLAEHLGASDPASDVQTLPRVPAPRPAPSHERVTSRSHQQAQRYRAEIEQCGADRFLAAATQALADAWSVDQAASSRPDVLGGSAAFTSFADMQSAWRDRAMDHLCNAVALVHDRQVEQDGAAKLRRAGVGTLPAAWSGALLDVLRVQRSLYSVDQVLHPRSAARLYAGERNMSFDMMQRAAWQESPHRLSNDQFSLLRAMVHDLVRPVRSQGLGFGD